ncbi:MAG: 5-deoxy-glucuronate isomerase [Thermoprotei archaeon]
MLYTRIGEGNALEKIFDYDHFSLYGLRAGSDVSFEIGPSASERLIFSLKGGFLLNGQGVKEKDMAYLPSNFKVRVAIPRGSAIYVAESRHSSSIPFYVKRYIDVPALEVGVRNYARRVKTMIGEGDPAVSFLAGYTEEYPGNWSSYPPHRHEGKPEVYIFYGVDPGYAIQMSIRDGAEEAYVVHDYDVFLITGGYHPHVSSPLTGSGYAWVIAAHGQRKLEVEVHPDFKGEELGKSHVTVRRPT